MKARAKMFFQKWFSKKTPVAVQKTTLQKKTNSPENGCLLITNKNPILKITITAEEEARENFIVKVNGKNLYNGTFEKGYLKDGSTNLYNKGSKIHRTTKWFPVLPGQGQSLVLSGTAHNRSTWQFKAKDETIITDVGISQKYNVITDVMQDKTVSKVDIPENAEYARVFYANVEDNILDNRLQIEYGKILTHYVPFQENIITLPRLPKGAIITYKNGVWSLQETSDSVGSLLEGVVLSVGNIITVDPRICTIEEEVQPPSNEIIYTGSYGVRWSRNDSNPVCERIGDAKGLTFNALHNGEDLTPYENSFDRIYPWSDLKVCTVKVDKSGKRQIKYSSEPDFNRDGSDGNVMVEIPKFYSKRELIDDFEYLWISATEQEGYILDPSFQTEKGIIDKIYIGAYHSRMINKRIESVSNSYPLIKKSLKDLQEMAAQTNGIMQCDLLAILTIQRLYLVETAVLDSQAIFAGEVHLPYLLKDKSCSFYAAKSEPATNQIVITDSKVTRRFCVGDAVSILRNWEEYRNQPDTFQREITSIKEGEKDTLVVTFTGKPMDIVERETGLTCLPCKNGLTDHINYSSASVGALSGHISFKYRGIENLWGNVSILLENAYVQDSQLYVKYPTGETHKIDFPIPVQKVELSPQKFGEPTNMVVKQMGYDKNHPLMMFPSEIGGGASTSSYYCDSWYNLAEEGVVYILTYGGAWDNKAYAGVFNFRASFTDTKRIAFNGSRIMIR
ncbi:MAG: hypothetical protein QM644_13335 [Mobilitalea sp.]